MIDTGVGTAREEDVWGHCCQRGGRPMAATIVGGGGPGHYTEGACLRPRGTGTPVARRGWREAAVGGEGLAGPLPDLVVVFGLG